MNRRSFLKLAGTLPLALALPPAVRRHVAGGTSSRQNVLVLVFDAWSAANVSLYGYARKTTPNIDRLAERAIVYRNHRSGANFTTAGTASLLTGTYPWTNGATMPWQEVSVAFRENSLFSAFDDYHRTAYTHNDLAYAVIRGFAPQIEMLPDVEDLFLKAPPTVLRHLFRADRDAAAVAWSRAMAVRSNLVGYSLFASHLLEMAGDNAQMQVLRNAFPRGLPSRGDHTTAFTLEAAFDWLLNQIAASPTPWLTYLHVLPPHAPYNTRLPYVDAFMPDGFQPVPKPFDPLAEYDAPELHQKRRFYDEYILYVDAQFASLYARLEAGGHLENTWLILTSDHGETFERGFLGHRTPTLYEPEIHIPLLVFEPGRRIGHEVSEPTSAVDVLPTLSHITGHRIPARAEGLVLPPFSSTGALHARDTYSFVDRHELGPMTWTASSIRWPYKIMYFNGYSRLGRLRTVNKKNVKILETLGGPNKLLRLFDLQADPDELQDLAVELPDVVKQMLPAMENALGSYLAGK